MLQCRSRWLEGLDDDDDDVCRGAGFEEPGGDGVDGGAWAGGLEDEDGCEAPLEELPLCLGGRTGGGGIGGKDLRACEGSECLSRLELLLGLSIAIFCVDMFLLPGEGTGRDSFVLSVPSQLFSSFLTC